MSNREFVLGVDLDGVVADFAGGLHPIAAEWCGVSVTELPTEVAYGFPEWELDKYGGYKALHRHAVKNCNLFERLEPVTGAAPSLRRLSALGIRIRIITHRLYIRWFHTQAISQTTSWLERHGIPFWDLCFMKDKSAVGADLYLEDSPANIVALRECNYDVIVVRNSTNRHIDGPGAESWDEIEALVKQKVQEWENKGVDKTLTSSRQDVEPSEPDMTANQESTASA